MTHLCYEQSCGWGVPYYKFQGHRKTLLTWGGVLEKNDAKFESKPLSEGRDPEAVAEQGMKNWWRKQNTERIDGLPALESAPFIQEKVENSVPDVKEGAFKTKEAAVEDLKGIDEGSVWALPRWSLSSDAGNLKLLSGILIGFCLAYLSIHLVEGKLAPFVRHLLP